MVHDGTYGMRARIGLIVPPTNTVNESEWHLSIPEGVSFHTHRMALHSDVRSQAGRAALDADLDASFAMLLPLSPDVIAYACTAGSMVTPAHDLPDALSRRHGVASITTSAAIISALKALGSKRLAVVTPYTDAMNVHEVAFLEAHGFTVMSVSGRGIGPPDFTPIARTPLDAVREQIETTVVAGIDAVLVLCTDYPTLALVTEMEAKLDLPFVTSNQATLWACLRAADLDDAPPFLGRLATH